jgi:hypothetical protein
VKLLDSLVARLAVMFVIAFKVLDDLFAAVLTLAYKVNAVGVAERLGRLTPGDDFNRLTPLMNAVPWWLHGLWVLAAGLYLTAILLVALRKGAAYVPVLAAFGIEVLAKALGRPIVAATGIVVNPAPSTLVAVVIPFVIPLVLALVLWMAGRKISPRDSSSE